MFLNVFLWSCLAAIQTEPRVNSRKFQKDRPTSNMWTASSARSSPLCLLCAKNSHFPATSTETGYLFLLTTLTLNIKPQVPPHVSCPGRNPRHPASPLALRAANEGEASRHKQTPNILLSFSARPCVFASPVWLGISQNTLESPWWKRFWTTQLDSWSKTSRGFHTKVLVKCDT